MTQKLLIGGLVVAIVAVIGFGLMDAGRVSQDVQPDASIEAAAVESVETTPAVEAPATTARVIQAQGAVGDPWQANGTIGALEDFGFTLITAEDEFYVELGPPTYWQQQAVTLAEGDEISVEGYDNGDQIHARVVALGNAELVLRNESGQPMWAGGASNAGSNQQGAGQMHLQVAPEDWLTLAGTIDTVTNGQVTLSVDDGSVLNLQMGRPDFWQSQGVTLTTGDPVEVLGFWSGDQFLPGDIRKMETGETIMLRDPNGRQLWAGPGRGGGNGQQSGGNGQQSGGSDQQSGGNQYRGGREG